MLGDKIDQWVNLKYFGQVFKNEKIANFPSCLGAECNETNIFQTYFWGLKSPIAAEIDGAKFQTLQWVCVVHS